MGQLDLFEQETPVYKLHRRDAPETSVQAAKKLDATKLEIIVLNAIKTFENGCISDDVRDYCLKHHGINSYSSVTARYKALEEKELIEYTGEKRKGVSGRNQRVMKRK